MQRNATGPTAVAVLAAASSATGPRRRIQMPAAVDADRSRVGRELRTGSAPRLGFADLAACRETLRCLGVAFGAGGQPDRAGPLLDAAEVLRELLERPEAPVRPGRAPHPEGTRCGLIDPDGRRGTSGGGWLTDVADLPFSRPRRPFSPRERDVLALLVEGCSNAAIAGALRIGQRTAETHVANILSKIGVSSRTAAIAFAVRHGLIV